MSLEDNFKDFDSYIKSKNLTEKETLLFISNYLLNNIDIYENLDKVYGINEQPLLDDYSNYAAIRQMREYHPDSIPLELAKIAHNLLYVYNRLQLMEEAQYGR